MGDAAHATLTERQQARRDALIEAGLRLLADRTYEQIQVKDVADEAGVSLGTLYHYFPAKERLFAEVLVHWADDLSRSIGRRPLLGDGPAERLTEATHRAVRAFGRSPQMARLVNTMVMSSDPFAWAIMTRLDHTTAAAYLDALAPMDYRRARAIVDVTNAVFGTGIREWSLGRSTLAAVADRLATTIELLLPVSDIAQPTIGGDQSG
jgi:AcrR family transcriptional regulator